MCECYNVYIAFRASENHRPDVSDTNDYRGDNQDEYDCLSYRCILQLITN